MAAKKAINPIEALEQEIAKLNAQLAKAQEKALGDASKAVAKLSKENVKAKS